MELFQAEENEVLYHLDMTTIQLWGLMDLPVRQVYCYHTTITIKEQMININIMRAGGVVPD